MRVVVIGGGYGGVATAARLAKLGHQVTVLERSDRLGGAVGSVSSSGFGWDTGPAAMLLPAVARDLFRKSGRPLERELELAPVPVIREHRFADGTALRLTGGSRAAQKAAFDALGQGLGTEWTEYVDALRDEWEHLRRDYFERPWDPSLADAGTLRLLRSRRSLHARLRRAFHDPRLRAVAAHPLLADGHDLRRVPAWAGTVSYVEQRFGAWTVPGGMAGLADALTTRLRTRRVEVRLQTEVEDVVLRDGAVRAVRTPDGEVDADAVVCAVDPRRLPSLQRYVRGTAPTAPPHVVHLGVRTDPNRPTPEPGTDLVLHGPSGPALVLRPGVEAPEGHQAWTVLLAGGPDGSGADPDLLAELAARGMDLRDRVVVRVDRTPQAQLDLWGGSPTGLQWDGRRTVRRRLGPRTPVTGLFAAGAHATPGAGLPFVGLSGALVAQALGPA